jgi:hypothetical protein
MSVSSSALEKMKASVWLYSFVVGRVRQEADR